MKDTFFEKLFLVALLFFMLIGFLIYPQMLDAQIKNIRFKHITVDDGLSHSWVHSILQDKYGFIWFGTDAGLDRFDGYSFREYKNNFRDTNSISSSCVTSMLKDSRGELWIGTREGLNLYDRKNDRFIKYSKVQQESIWSIAEDKDKNLWIGATSNFWRYNLENDSVYTYNLPQKSVTARSIFVDSRNNVWIGTYYGLLLYDKERNSFVHYYHDANDSSSLGNNNIWSILEDKAGKLWIGTQAGLDLFTNAQQRPQKGIFEHYQNDSKDESSISNGAVLSLLEDDKHNLWIGTENGGLDMIDLTNFQNRVNTFIHFKNDPSRTTSLSNNSIYSLCQDEQGNIWIGTHGDGINRINLQEDKFIHLKSELGSKRSLNNSQVNTFLEEEDFLWIGTEGGLNRYNKREDTFTHFVYNPSDKRSIGSNAVWAICKDKLGNLWVGTWGGGLNKFNYKTETFEHYYNDPKDTNSIGNNNIFSIIEDSRGNLLIGTMGGGLNIFDRKKKIFTRYNTSNSGINTNYVSSIIEAKNGNIWLADETSIEHFDIVTKKFENFTHSANDSTSLSSNKVISIFEDSKGNFWAGTNAGLNLFNKSTKGFTCYRTENGLPDNSINSILEDDHGNLWIGTDKGLSKFNNAVNLPAKPEFKNYTHEDGLQGNGFRQRSSCKGTDGLMYFGGSNGFNVFDPDNVPKNSYIPPIVITNFQIFNKPVNIGERGLGKETGVDEDLILSHTQSFFSFDFAALNYIASSKNQYAYKMEGFDKDWYYVGTKHTVNYTNLNPGKYIFRVKGSNNDGVWNEKGVALPIIIKP
ncbi:MAG: two-component regulator propeller domain-containing protein [Bacteroidota bacterium]|jgi:ligand-binding sensor domain-containing protein